MIRYTLVFLTLLLSNPSYSAEKYILVVFHGKGVKEAPTFSEKKNIDARLRKVKIDKYFNGSHNVQKKNFSQILDHFQCVEGIQKEKDLGLIIIGYSWGAKRAYDFSKAYLNKCGKKADRSYIIDGILKLISPFPAAPIGSVCKNYYKTIFPIRGKPLMKCENFDKTELCTQKGGDYTQGMKCHQLVIQEGFSLAIEDIIQNL